MLLYVLLENNFDNHSTQRFPVGNKSDRCIDLGRRQEQSTSCKRFPSPINSQYVVRKAEDLADRSNGLHVSL